MISIEIIIIQIVILLLSVVIHELSHGYVAFALGDDTAKRAGRLTLNPIKHLDPMGSLLLPALLLIIQSPIMFGWAKPVPVNPYNFQDKKYGNAKVAIAGALANFCLALIFGLALRFFPVLFTVEGVSIVFLYIVKINLILGIFNLLPIPPLDGSHVLFTFVRSRELKMFFMRYGLIFLVLVLYFVLPYLSWFVQWLTKILIGI